MKHARLAAAILLVAVLAACGKSSNVSTQSAGASSAAANSVAGGTVVAPAGSTYRGKLDKEISSKTSHDGDTFALVAINGTGPLAGSSIEGHLANVQAAGLAKKPAMTIVFDDVLLSDGTKVPIDVQLVSYGLFGAKSHHWRTIGMVLGGGMAGHMAAGRHHGGLLGAAGGYMLSQQMKTDIDVKPGTVVAVKFLAPATEGAAAATPQST
jgi:hypothetical protein